MPRSLAWQYLLLLPLFLLPLCDLQAADPVTRVVYHLNDGTPIQHYRLLRNINNHFEASPPGSLEVKVMVHGEGVGLLLLPESGRHIKGLIPNATADNRRHIDQLRARGVVFIVSAATLRHHGIDPASDLYGVAADQIVPNGLAYLTELQAQGYTYLKP